MDYSCDHSGNLLSDGMRRFLRPHQPANAGGFRDLDNGICLERGGVRAGKTTDGAGTQYVLDLEARLPVVISDTEGVYVRLDAIYVEKRAACPALFSHMAGATGLNWSVPECQLASLSTPDLLELLR